MWKILLFLTATSPEHALNSVYIARTPDSFGTAFAIDDTRLLTAKHLVEGIDEITLVNVKGEGEIGKVSFRGSLDFAVITIAKTKKRLPIRKTAPKMGDKVHYIGHPNGFFFSYHEGYVSLPNILFFGERRIGSFVYSGGGASGSPVMDKNNRVIGVLTEHMAGYSLVVPMEEICKEIKCGK